MQLVVTTLQASAIGSVQTHSETQLRNPRVPIRPPTST